MPKFRIIKKIDLGYLGDEWKDCYVSFTQFSIGELYKLGNEWSLLSGDDESRQAITNVLEEQFVEGYGIDSNGSRIKMVKEDIKELPLSVFVEIVEKVSDIGVKKKLEMQLGSQSSEE